MSDPLLGRVLDDRYRVVERIGAGAMAVVYRAEQADGSPVAVKVLSEELGGDAKQRERFEREARALFGLQHPNILEVHDFGIVDGAPYLAMEMLQGDTLDRVYEDAPPDPDAALELARQILTGLAFAHAQGVLHRDLKTENVFVTRAADGRPVAKLLDFGLVKFVDEDRWGSGDKLTTFGSVFGTPAYMSPEQVTGTSVYPASDVYAAGVILFELLTGLWPFMEEERTDMFRAHLTMKPPSLAETRPDVTFAPELEALVAKALAKAPSARFANAGEMLAALEALPRPAARAPGAAQTGAPGSSGVPWRVLVPVAIGVGGLLLLGLAAAVVALAVLL